MRIKNLVLSVYRDITHHWNRPKKGGYISYKEIAAYSVGGMGIQFLATMLAYVALTANSFLFGSAFGLDPVHLQLMNIAATVLNFVLVPIRGMLIDNIRSKAGKFRPFILWMGIPTAILSTLVVFVPVDSAYMVKVAVLFLLFVTSQFFYQFLYTAHTNLVNVMSPDSQERTKTIAINSIVFSMAPTITGVLIPLVAGMFPNQMADIGTYRLLFPILNILGLALSFFAYFGTKERIIVSKQYVPRVKFIDGLEKVIKNKYFWIINISLLFNPFKIAIAAMFPWLMQYGIKTEVLGMDNMALYATLSLIIGTASLPGMALAPLFIKKFGKRKIIMASNFIFIAGIALMYFTYTNVLVFFVFYYIVQFSNALQIVTTPAVNSDIADYQQYRTGDRLDGSINYIGNVFTSLVALGTGLIVPIMYRYFGLGTDYDVLYVDDIRNNIFMGIIIVTLIGGILVAIPYFLYDLKESKHANMIKVLRIRAMFEDYANGVATDGQIVDAIKEIERAKEALDAEPSGGKEKLAAAKAMPANTKEEKKAKRDAIKAAKKIIYEDKVLLENKASAQIVFDELTKFSSGKLGEDVEKAKALIAGGFDGMINIDPELLAKAKALPNTNLKEIAARDKAIREAKRAAKYSKKIQKVYPNGVVEPAADLIQTAVEAEYENNKLRRKAIKEAENEVRTFMRTVRPLIEARKLVKQEADYQAYDAIMAQYPEMLMRITALELAEEERSRQQEADFKAEMEEFKQAKFDALPPKKQEKILQKRAKKEAKKNQE